MVFIEKMIFCDLCLEMKKSVAYLDFSIANTADSKDSLEQSFLSVRRIF